MSFFKKATSALQSFLPARPNYLEVKTAGEESVSYHPIPSSHPCFLPELNLASTAESQLEIHLARPPAEDSTRYRLLSAASLPSGANILDPLVSCEDGVDTGNMSQYGQFLRALHKSVSLTQATAAGHQRNEPGPSTKPSPADDSNSLNSYFHLRDQQPTSLDGMEITNYCTEIPPTSDRPAGLSCLQYAFSPTGTADEVKRLLTTHRYCTDRAGQRFATISGSLTAFESLRRLEDYLTAVEEELLNVKPEYERLVRVPANPDSLPTEDGNVERV